MSHDIFADFKAEFELYERSGALVAHLAAHWRQKNSPEGAVAAAAAGSPSALSPARIQGLAIEMYEYGILQEEDVGLTRAWVQDLLGVGYTFNPPGVSTTVEGARKDAADLKPNAEGEEEGQAAYTTDDWHSNSVEFTKEAASAKGAVAAEASAAQTHLVATRSLVELKVTEALLLEDNGQQQLNVQAEAEIGIEEAENVDKPSVLLVIAVVTIRPERRTAIRNSWLAWGDDRLVLRFFTEAPDESQPQGQDEAKALKEESAAYGDLVVLDIERGMNFAVKLLSAMKYVSGRYKFDFFLRLDDDYFLCLDRLLDELEATKNSLANVNTLAYEGRNSPLPPLMLYAGFRYCKPDMTRIDEAYMLLSGALVHRVLSITDLRCGSHAGVSAGWWFTVDHDANKAGDVRWVHDKRLDHRGILAKRVLKSGEAPSTYASVCETHMGVHHAYPEEMVFLWEAAKDTPTQQLSGVGGEITIFPYLTTDKCENTDGGVDTEVFLQSDNVQPCDSFHAKEEVYCGAQGC